MVSKHDFERAIYTSDLSPSQRLVALAFSWHSDYATGTNIRCSNRTVARETGLHRNTVNSLVAQLVCHGLLIPVGVAAKGITVYALGVAQSECQWASCPAHVVAQPEGNTGTVVVPENKSVAQPEGTSGTVTVHNLTNNLTSSSSLQEQDLTATAGGGGEDDLSLSSITEVPCSSFAEKRSADAGGAREVESPNGAGTAPIGGVNREQGLESPRTDGPTKDPSSISEALTEAHRASPDDPTKTLRAHFKRLTLDFADKSTLDLYVSDAMNMIDAGDTRSLEVIAKEVYEHDEW